MVFPSTFMYTFCEFSENNLQMTSVQTFTRLLRHRRPTGSHHAPTALAAERQQRHPDAARAEPARRPAPPPLPPPPRRPQEGAASPLGRVRVEGERVQPDLIRVGQGSPLPPPAVRGAAPGGRTQIVHWIGGWGSCKGLCRLFSCCTRSSKVCGRFVVALLLASQISNRCILYSSCMY